MAKAVIWAGTDAEELLGTSSIGAPQLLGNTNISSLRLDPFTLSKLF